VIRAASAPSSTIMIDIVPTIIECLARPALCHRQGRILPGDYQPHFSPIAFIRLFVRARSQWLAGRPQPANER